MNEHQSNGLVEPAVQTVGVMIQLHKLALEKSYGKELDSDRVEIPRLIMHAWSHCLKWAPMGGLRTRDPVANRTGNNYSFSVSACSTFRWAEREAERTSLKRSPSMECIED